MTISSALFRHDVVFLQEHCASPAFIGYTPLDTPWKDYEMRKGFTRKPQAGNAGTDGKCGDRRDVPRFSTVTDLPGFP